MQTQDAEKMSTEFFRVKYHVSVSSFSLHRIYCVLLVVMFLMEQFVNDAMLVMNFAFVCVTDIRHWLNIDHLRFIVIAYVRFNHACRSDGWALELCKVKQK